MQSDNRKQSFTRWISDRTIANRYEIARSTVWAWTRAGKLPKPVKLGENITRWNEDEIERFMRSFLQK